MKTPNRFLMMAIAAIAIVFAVATAHAQPFPQCNAGGITINNHSCQLVNICIKQVNCFNVPPSGSIFVPVPAGTDIPGCYGVANITYPWSANPTAPPALWIQSLAMNPSGDCFNVYFDQPTCTIDIFQTFGPPCLHP